jgi:hypothetical protein
VFGAKQLTQSINSKLLLENTQENCLPDSSKKNYFIQKDFLESLEIIEEHSFISYWYSYGNKWRRFSEKNTSLNFIKEILRMEEAKEIFEIMIKSYKKYLRDNLFKEFLGPLSKEDKENLLLQAISLYQGRFRSVWVRFGKPGPKKFNNWPRIFSFFKRIIDLGIYDSIEAVFHKIMKNIGPVMNEEEIYKLRSSFVC